MDKKATQHIEKLAHVALTNCVFQDGIPVFASFGSDLKKLTCEVLKHKEKWVSESDIQWIFIEKILVEIIAQTKVGNQSDLLINVLGADVTSRLAAKISDFLCSLPRRYKVFAPLPSLAPLGEDVVIADGYNVQVVTSRTTVPGSLYAPLGLLSSYQDIDPPIYCVAFEVEGYFGRDFSSSAAKNALSAYKVCLQQSLSLGLLAATKTIANGLVRGFMITADAFTVPKCRIILHDKDGGPSLANWIELPMEICRFLDTHVLSSAELGGVLPSDNRPTDQRVASILKAAAALHFSESREVTRIKWAIEWAFDAYANENTTISFLQTCIGLEAIYGDGNDGEGLTKTLADRCAYLLASSLEERGNIRRKFQQLYKMRSKIVHGNAVSLAHADKELLQWGQGILQLSIAKETWLFLSPARNELAAEVRSRALTK